MMLTNGGYAACCCIRHTCCLCCRVSCLGQLLQVLFWISSSCRSSSSSSSCSSASCSIFSALSKFKCPCTTRDGLEVIRQASERPPIAHGSALNYKPVSKLLRHALFRCKLMTSCVAADRLSTEHEIDGFIDGEGRGVRWRGSEMRA